MKNKTYSTNKSLARCGIVMVIPSMLTILVFTILPIVQSFYISFFDWNILKNIKNFIGLNNYIKMFTDDRFYNALKNTFVYTTCYLPILVIISIAIAALLSKTFLFKKFFKTIIFMPSLISLAIIGIIFRFLFDGNVGFFSLFMQKFGFVTQDLLRSTSTALATVIFVSAWKWIGFNVIIFLAGMTTIPESMYEAARIDGANEFKQFFKITLPLLLPTIAFVVVTNLISSLQVFDQIYVMTKGGPMFSTEVLVYYIYYLGFTVFSMGYASSIAFFLFLIVFIITVIQLRIFCTGEENTGAWK